MDESVVHQEADDEDMVEVLEDTDVGGRGTTAPLQDELFINPEHLSSLLTQLNNYRRESDMTDLVIIVGDAQFPCHRTILAGCSEFFHRVLQNLPPYSGSRVHSLVVKDIPVEIMEIFLSYCYTGVAKFTDDNIDFLLEAADFFQVKQLSNACREFLEKQRGSSVRQNDFV